MKTFTTFLVIVLLSLSATGLFAEDSSICSNSVLWVRNCTAKHPEVHQVLQDDSSDIHISSYFKVSDDGNSLCFEMANPYNCLRWMETVWSRDGMRLVPDTDNCYAAPFVYSKKTGTWNGGIIGEIQTPLLQRVNISKIYSGLIDNWPQLKSRLNNNVPMRFCLCKFIRGRWRRSNWAYNFDQE